MQQQRPLPWPGRLLGTARIPLASAALLLLAAAAACSSTEPGGTQGTGHTDAHGTRVTVPAEPTSELVFPDPALPGGADAETAARLELGDGTELAVWIDVDDARRVLLQESDGDAAAWSAPVTLATSGDGCLMVRAASDATLAAATLYCYSTDAFIEQAPDEAFAVVRSEDGEWFVYEHLELTGTPTFSNGEVFWRDELSWSPSSGFVTAR